MDGSWIILQNLSLKGLVSIAMHTQRDVKQSSALHSLGGATSWTELSVRFLLVSWSLILALSACARDGNSPPQLLNLQDYLLTANQNFRLEITAFDPDQDYIEFNFNLSPPPPTPTETSGGIPTLNRTSNTQAVFNWTPGIADAGQYDLTIIVSDPEGDSSEETINLTVMESAGSTNLWVRFVEPQSDATVIYLDQTPCLGVDVKIQSDQLSAEEIQLSLLPPSPVSATLMSSIPKTYRLTWCPQDDEVAVQTNFPFVIRASAPTRGLAPIDKRYLVRVITQASDQCPGAPPTISHLPPADYTGVANLALDIEVTDDIGIKSAPTVSYQIEAFGAAAPLGDDWQTILMSGESTGATTLWTALIPPPIPPADPANATIFYRFLVNDDDDPDGARCDHSVESTRYQVNYTWSTSAAQPGAGLCDFCVHDLQCGNIEDQCLLAVEGGVCGKACGHDRPCPMGFQCQQLPNVEGVMVAQCVSENACGQACRPDLYEPAIPNDLNNDLPAQATPLMSGSYTQLSICAGDVDHYQVNVGEGQSVTARIEFSAQRGDLDLEVMNERGVFPIQRSVSSRQDFEEVTVRCVTQATSALIHVYGFEGAQNDYDLELRVEDLPCDGTACPPDRYEGVNGNNTAFDATVAQLNMSYDGQICPRDIDMYAVILARDAVVRATLEFDPTQGDLALDVLDENQSVLESADMPTGGIEEIEFIAPEQGEFYFKVLSPQANGNLAYRLTFGTGGAGGTGCVSSLECGSDEYCDATGNCISNACSSSCTAGHACVSPLAGRAPLGESGICAPVCSSDAACRPGERCKAFESFTPRCAPAGSADVAGSCNSFADCADDLICLPTSGGYCATAACSSDQDCSSDTLCANLAGVQGCLKRCVNDQECGRPDLSCQSFSGGRACAP